MQKLTRVFTAPTYTEAATATATQRFFDVPDSHGLHLAYTTDDHAGDIVFIHGLGGSPRKTWSRGHGTGAFWPHWLSDDGPAAPSTTTTTTPPHGDADALSRFRLWAFGYNAKFKGPQTNLEIADFATDLLLLLCGETRIRESSRRGRRSTPILLVGHSLGGLVAKKACAMLAAAGGAGPYAALRGRIRGILFLATPHRGSPYAGVLNNVLTVAPAAGGASSQPYVAELAARSAVVQGISNEFRDEAQGMLLCSFYETKKMRVGFTSIMVVDEASSVMGYAHELSYGLEADHRSICKYRSRNDENFCKVKAVLKMWTCQLVSIISGLYLWAQYILTTASSMLGLGELGKSRPDARGTVDEAALEWRRYRACYEPISGLIHINEGVGPHFYYDTCGTHSVFAGNRRHVFCEAG